ncbi:MAG: hypothetical protein JST51_18485 [Armatimonadetes bacterium]|nr:hypothetical protein [Armatimonadota bacterium]
MKIRYAAIMAIILGVGCSKPSAGPIPTDCPHFTFETSVKGRLFQVAPNGDVLIQSADFAGYRGNEMDAREAKYPSWGDLQGYQVEIPKLKILSNGQLKDFPFNGFLTKDNQPAKFLDKQIIQAPIDGRNVVLRPLRICDTMNRYYVGQDGIYTNKSDKPEIHLLSKIVPADSVTGCEGYLAYSHQDEKHESEVVRIHGAGNPEIVYHAPVADPKHVYEDGSMIVSEGNAFVYLDPTGKPLRFDHASFDLVRFHLDGKAWFFGFQREKKSDDKIFNYPCLWNDLGNPVPLIKICPSLANKVTTLKTMYEGAVDANDRGDLAFEMGGDEEITDRDESRFVSTRSVISTYILHLAKN